MKKFAWLALVGLVACGEEHGDEHAGEVDLAAEACEHTTEGPFVDVVATAGAAGAPSIAYEHTGVRIALSGDARTVQFEAPAAGDYAFFASAEVAIAFADAAGTVLPVEATEPVAACEAVAVQHTVALPVGTAFLTFAPGPTQVTVVVEAVVDAHGH